MKKYLALLIILWSTGTICIAQPTQPLKGATKIIVTTEFDKETNYNTAMNTLLDANYEPSETNKEFFTIKTSIKSVKAASYYLFIRSKDKEIIITGQFKMDITVAIGNAKTEEHFYPIENKGMKGSELKETFNKMDALANALKGFKNRI